MDLMILSATLRSAGLDDPAGQDKHGQMIAGHCIPPVIVMAMVVTWRIPRLINLIYKERYSLHGF
jgi:hypothetical protein